MRASKSRVRPVWYFCMTTSLSANDCATSPPARCSRALSSGLWSISSSPASAASTDDNMSCGITSVGNREKPETTPVDPKQRYIVPRHQARPVEQGPVSADRDQQVRPLAEDTLRHARHGGVRGQPRVLAHEHMH